MRPTIIAGNWKMNTDLASGPALIGAVKDQVLAAGYADRVGVILCPPFLLLDTARMLLKNSPIGLGAQNLHYEQDGAFTGEISATMLTSAGCTHVIVGHSERRQFFGETDAIVNRKVHQALAHGLRPIVCVGETLDQREQGMTEAVVDSQVRGVLAGVPGERLSDLIIAYEPVWAIGTGRTATPEQAQEVHARIRALVATLYDGNRAESLVIQYGGSMKPDNAAELLRQPDVDGGLIGGASLKADQFLAIVRHASERERAS